MPQGRGILPAEAFEVLGRSPLANRQQAQLLRCGNKLLLVCVGAAGAETLTEITDPAEVERLVETCRRGRSGAAVIGREFGRQEGEMDKSRLIALVVLLVALGFAATAIAEDSAQSARQPAGFDERGRKSDGRAEDVDQSRGAQLDAASHAAVDGLSLAPAVLLMTTCFIRIVVVLSLLRQAIGRKTCPPRKSSRRCRCS